MAAVKRKHFCVKLNKIVRVGVTCPSTLIYVEYGSFNIGTYLFFSWRFFRWCQMNYGFETNHLLLSIIHHHLKFVT